VLPEAPYICAVRIVWDSFLAHTVLGIHTVPVVYTCLLARRFLPCWLYTVNRARAHKVCLCNRLISLTFSVVLNLWCEVEAPRRLFASCQKSCWIIGLWSGLGRWHVLLPFTKHYFNFLLQSINSLSHSLYPFLSPYIDRNLEGGGRSLLFCVVWGEVQTNILCYLFEIRAACILGVFLFRTT